MRFGARLITLVAVAAATLTVAPGARAAGQNLAPNSSFEQSVFRPVVDHEQFPEPQLPDGSRVRRQPILPEGWIFEGAAGLFDHAPRNAVSGDRIAAISDPLSTNARYCAAEGACQDNPLRAAKAAADPVYSVDPHWRTAEPISVQAGACYVFGSWMSGELLTVGEGPAAKIRFVDAAGLPVAVVPGPFRTQQGSETQQPPDVLLDWAYAQTEVHAPEGAAGAILMLGHSDDLWISQVRFDDVYFGTC